MYLYLLSLPSAVVGWPSSLGDIDDWPSADLLSIKKKYKKIEKTKQNKTCLVIILICLVHLILYCNLHHKHTTCIIKKKTYPCVLLLRLIIVRFALKSQILQCKFLFKKNQEIRLFSSYIICTFIYLKQETLYSYVINELFLLILTTQIWYYLNFNYISFISLYQRDMVLILVKIYFFVSNVKALLIVHQGLMPVDYIWDTGLAILTQTQLRWCVCLHFECWKKNSRLRPKVNMTNPSSCLIMIKNQLVKELSPVYWTNVKKKNMVPALPS